MQKNRELPIFFNLTNPSCVKTKKKERKQLLFNIL